ncbi:MAG: hypothetical protein WCJ81_06610 [bacterium]
MFIIISPIIVYLPRYHLFPSHPQILHHLVMEFFLMAPEYREEKETFVTQIPYGPLYRYGAVLAEQRKYIFQSHPAYEHLVIIIPASLPPKVA